MESMFKSDRKALGALILHEIIQNKKRNSREKKSIWQAFQYFSNDLGDDFMDYPDFEHFYLKLEKGECDLDYDGRLRYDRHLCDLPVDIIKMIVAKLTTDEKWLFCESSPSLHKIIDPQFRGCKKLEIFIFEESGSVVFNGGNLDTRLRIAYYITRSEETGEMEVRRDVMCKKLGNGGKTVEESMIRDIRQMLDNPRTRLIDLDIRSTLPADNSFFRQLKSLLESQKKVRKVSIHAKSPTNFHYILGCLNPKTVENIELKSNEERMDLSEILEMDQMKEAKRVTLRCPRASYPLKDVLHFEEFDRYRKSWNSTDVLKIKNESTRTGNMKRFRAHLSGKIPTSSINKLLGPLNSQFNDTAGRRHFRIQHFVKNSGEFMKMVVFNNLIEFHRVPRIE